MNAAGATAALWALALAALLATAAEARATAAGGGGSDNYDDQDELVNEAAAAGGGAVVGAYDPYARDFTQRCQKLAKYSNDKACEMFLECCSEDYVLNKLNGDRCQRADVHNGCTLGETGNIIWSMCRAYNCTAEVTTTTTMSTPGPGSSASARPCTAAFLIAAIAGALTLIVLPHARVFGDLRK